MDELKTKLRDTLNEFLSSYVRPYLSDVYQKLRYILSRNGIFYLALYCFNYFNPSQYQASWKLIWFIVSYGIRPALHLLVWLLRKRKLALLIKGCAQSSTKGIEKQVFKTLINDIAKQCIHIADRPWDQDLDDGQQPVIVFCVISSRIGTDIENTMRGVHGKSRVILVLLHCVLKDLLRGSLSDDEKLLDPGMKDRMEGIIHFAFSDREGLYDCHQNKVGFHELLYRVTSLPLRSTSWSDLFHSFFSFFFTKIRKFCCKN